MPGEHAPYVESAAVVGGPAAHVLDRIMKAPRVRRIIELLPEPLRSEVAATRRAIALAAAAYEARSVVSGRSHETPGTETAPPSPGEITTREAAALLGVSERRCQQLAAGGLGRRVAGRWLLDKSAVLAYRDRRRAAQLD